MSDQLSGWPIKKAAVDAQLNGIEEEAPPRPAPRRSWFSLLVGSRSKGIRTRRISEDGDERQSFKLTEPFRTGETEFKVCVSTPMRTSTTVLTVSAGAETQAYVLKPARSTGWRSALVHIPRTVVEVRVDVTSVKEADSVRILAREVGAFEAIARRVAWSSQRLGVAPRRLPAIFRRVWHVAATQGPRGLLHALRSQQSPVERAYLDWIEAFDKLTERDRREIRAQIGKFPSQPTILVALTRSRFSTSFALRTIESVLRQLYPKWVLWIMRDVAATKELQSFLLDPRISQVPDTEGAPPSNERLTQTVAADWVVFVEAGDELSERALFEIVNAANRSAEAAVIYSDEDALADGIRCGPQLKPDWSPERERSTNYLGQLTAYRWDVLQRVEQGGVFQAAALEPYALALRCTDELKHGEVVHLPLILFHRAVPFEKEVIAGRLLGDLAAQQPTRVTIEEVGGPVSHRLRYALPQPAPLVSIIIPTRDRRALLEQCIQSVRARTTYSPYEILVVDNGSREPDAIKYLQSLVTGKLARVIQHDGPFNFSEINNRAVKQAHGEVLCFLNNDIQVKNQQWLSEMVSLCLLPGVGAVGAKLYYPDGTIQHAGVVLGLHGLVGHLYRHVPQDVGASIVELHVVREVAAVTAACLVTRKDVFERVGGFEAEHLKVAFNDVDLCLRLLSLGLRNLWTPYAELFHYESASRGYDTARRSRGRAGEEADWFRNRWQSLLHADPYFNPNLSLFSDIPTLAWPPRVPSVASQ